MTEDRIRHLLGIEDLSVRSAERVLDTAQAFLEVTRRPVRKVPALRGKTIINVFFEASTRTRTSFELAGKRLSADVVNIGGSSSSTRTRGTVPFLVNSPIWTGTSGNLSASRAGATSCQVPASVAADNSTTNRLPPFGGLSATTVPPCCFTKPSTMGSPNPVPSPGALVVKNGSKMRA